VFSLTPVLESSWLAVELTLPKGASTNAVQWFNNDGEPVFPEVLICAAGVSGEPELGQPLMRCERVAGPSSDWATVTLPGTLTAGAERLFVVFRLPPNVERTGVGSGGGPGLGYWAAEGGPLTFLGGTDQEWVRLSARFHVAVAPVVAGKAYGLASARTAPVVPEQPSPEIVTHLETALLPPAPNPANPSVQVRFTLAESGLARVTLYNLRGERVATLADSHLTAGEHLLHWNGRDDAGAVVASGVYFARLDIGGRALTRRFALVR